jgi:hypothetical protein
VNDPSVQLTACGICGDPFGWGNPPRCRPCQHFEAHLKDYLTSPAGRLRVHAELMNAEIAAGMRDSAAAMKYLLPDAVKSVELKHAVDPSAIF